MEGQCYQGVVKSFKGSFGFISCGEVAEKFGGRDTFLHKNDVNGVPQEGSRVSFRLVLDAKSNPKAEAATLEVREEEERVKAPATPRAIRDVRRAAALPIRDGPQAGEVLVLRHAKGGGAPCWSDLGGRVEPGESHLECALRELGQKAEGFLSGGSVDLLRRGLLEQFAEGGGAPEFVTVKRGGRPQTMAVFLLNCSGVSLELSSPEGPNGQGVHELRWLSRGHPDLRDREATRWPLLRAACALFGGGQGGRRRPQPPRSRSRSRGRGPQSQPVTLQLMATLQTPASDATDLREGGSGDSSSDEGDPAGAAGAVSGA